MPMSVVLHFLRSACIALSTRTACKGESSRSAWWKMNAWRQTSNQFIPRRRNGCLQGNPCITILSNPQLPPLLIGCMHASQLKTPLLGFSIQTECTPPCLCLCSYRSHIYMHQQQLKGHVRILVKGHHLAPFFPEKKKTLSQHRCCWSISELPTFPY
jgi:hypothetical protein